MTTNIDFPPIFQSLKFKEYKWDDVKCTIGSNNTFYWCEIQTSGPFLFLFKIGMFKLKKYNSAIFLQNYLIKEAPDKNEIYLLVKSPAESMPSITFNTRDTTKFKEISGYIKNSSDKFAQFLLDKKEIKNNYYMYDVESDGKLIKHSINLLFFNRKWQVQFLVNYRPSATFECNENEIMVFPFSELQDKFSPELKMKSFFIAKKENDKLSYTNIITENQQQMITWVLYIYYSIYLNALLSGQSTIIQDSTQTENIKSDTNNDNDHDKKDDDNDAINFEHISIDFELIDTKKDKDDDDKISNIDKNQSSIDDYLHRSFESSKRNAEKNIKSVQPEKVSMIDKNDDYKKNSDQEDRIKKQLSDLDNKYHEYKKDTFIPPNFKNIISNKMVFFNSKANFSLDLQSLLKSVGNNFDEDNIIEISINQQNEDQIVKDTLDDISIDENFDLTEIFDFTLYPQYDVNKLKNSCNPQNNFIDTFSSTIVNLKSSEQNLNMNQSDVLTLCYLVASLLVNGLKEFIDTSSRVSIPPFCELSDDFVEIDDIIKKENYTKTCKQASVASTIILQKKLLCTLLYEIKNSHEWSSKYYQPYAMLSNNTFIDDLINIIESDNSTPNASSNPLSTFESLKMEIEVTPNIFKEKLPQFAFTPLFEYLEIDDLLNHPEKDKVDVIFRQFKAGLKNNKPWAILEAIVKKLPNSENLIEKDFKQSITSQEKSLIDKVKSTVSSRIDDDKFSDWIKNAIESKMIHQYFILIHIYLNILKMDEYYSDSSLMDPYKVCYIVKKLHKIIS